MKRRNKFGKKKVIRFLLGLEGKVAQNAGIEYYHVNGVRKCRDCKMEIQECSPYMETHEAKCRGIQRVCDIRDVFQGLIDTL